MMVVVKFWGEFLQKNGLDNQVVWFETEQEANKYIEYMRSRADHYQMVLVCSKQVNAHVEYRTIAKMVFEYNGERIPFEYDFGYGYEASDAEYMFKEGNYSCDCNRADFLHLPKMDCGDKIKLTEFEVVFR